MKTHEVKSWPEYFSRIVSGDMLFQVRKNDRDYRIGDTVVFQEFRPNTGAYTGRKITTVITNIIMDGPAVAGEGLKKGYCVFGFRKVE